MERDLSGCFWVLSSVEPSEYPSWCLSKFIIPALRSGLNPLTAWVDGGRSEGMRTGWKKLEGGRKYHHPQQVFIEQIVSNVLGGGRTENSTEQTGEKRVGGVHGTAHDTGSVKTRLCIARVRAGP